MKVPSACAKKGKMKCFGSINGMAATKPSSVARSSPDGGDINIGPSSTKAILTKLPAMMAITIDKMDLKIGCMFTII